MTILEVNYLYSTLLDFGGFVKTDEIRVELHILCEGDYTQFIGDIITRNIDMTSTAGPSFTVTKGSTYMETALPCGV